MKIMRPALVHFLKVHPLKVHNLTPTTQHAKCIVSLLVVVSLSACSHIRQSSALSSDSSSVDAGTVESTQDNQATTEAARAYLAMLQEKEAASAEDDRSTVAEKQKSSVQESPAQEIVAQPVEAHPVVLEPVVVEQIVAQQVMTPPVPVVAQTEPEALVIIKEAKQQALTKDERAHSNEFNVAIQSATVPAKSVAKAQAQSRPQVEQQSLLEQVVPEQVAIDEINRLTEAQPTAAIAKNYQVLPEVETSFKELSVPNEILLLAPAADYTPKVSEYGMWKIAKGDHSLYRENCTLASTSMQVALDNYSTQIWLNVVGDDLLVNSTTNIDIRKPRVGVKLDNGPLQPFTKKQYATSAVWSGDLKQALQNNKQLSVVIGGDELGNRTKEVAVELVDLKRAYSEYTKCNANTRIGAL